MPLSSSDCPTVSPMFSAVVSSCGSSTSDSSVKTVTGSPVGLISAPSAPSSPVSVPDAVNSCAVAPSANASSALAIVPPANNNPAEIATDATPNVRRLIAYL